jgi:hypothetical protein
LVWMLVWYKQQQLVSDQVRTLLAIIFVYARI